MPKRDRSEPLKTQSYTFHGVDFHRRDAKEWIGTCPFCQKQKFYCDSETGTADCKYCSWQDQYKEDGVSGNIYGFLRYLWRVSFDQTQDIDYSWIEAHRQLPRSSLREWGICKSITTNEWIVPGYGIKDPPNITQLYRYIKQQDGSYALWLTPGMGKEGTPSHGILLPRLFNDNTSTIYVAEGVWDAIALRRTLQTDKSLEMWREVIAVPGCHIYSQQWNKYLEGKDVVFLYDNDHYKLNKVTNLPEQPGYKGTIRAVAIASTVARSMSWLDWGSDGKGYSSFLPDKYDVRDWLVKNNKSVTDLLALVKPVPEEWKTNTSFSQQEKVEPLKVIQCKSWVELTDAFKLAAKWTPELHGALAVSLACVSSVMGIGEPLWVRLISVPSSYKSQLCKAIGTNTRFTIMDDGHNGFYSGAITADGKNHSLVSKWNGKCLITKEGATLFTNARSEEIVGQARAIYDGEFTKDYKNGVVVSSKNWRGTWLLAGTPNMKDYDSNELGPRFVDYIIIKNITDEVEDDIVMRAIQEQGHFSIAGNTTESSDDPSYINARKLCGGYINYLRQNVDDGTLTPPPFTLEYGKKINVLAKFIERIRARPSKKLQSEHDGVALSARVAKQLMKLTQFLSIVMQKKSIDKEVMDIVYKVAMDTSDGWSYRIVEVLVASTDDEGGGLDPDTLYKKCKKTQKEMGSLIQFLQTIKVLELYQPNNTSFPYRQEKLRLTNSFRILYNQVREMRS